MMIEISYGNRINCRNCGKVNDDIYGITIAINGDVGNRTSIFLCRDCTIALMAGLEAAIEENEVNE